MNFYSSFQKIYTQDHESLKMLVYLFFGASKREMANRHHCRKIANEEIIFAIGIDDEKRTRNYYQCGFFSAKRTTDCVAVD
jgi:hypothetical protein